MNKKGVSDIGNYIISIIIFTFFIVGGISMIASFSSYDNTFIGDAEKYQEFNNSFNTYDDIQDNVGDIESSIKNTEADAGLFGFLNALIGSAWNTLKLTFSSFTFMTSAFLGLNTVFGIPVWIPTLIGLIITIIIAFAIYKAIFQVQ